jgi:Cd2+/Zn2+-exporting ATPase
MAQTYDQLDEAEPIKIDRLRGAGLSKAEIALMADDLSRLPSAVGFSRHARGIIIQNVFIGVVALLVLATVLKLGIRAAVAAHEGLTLVVVVNALRLPACRNRRQTADRAAVE